MQQWKEWQGLQERLMDEITMMIQKLKGFTPKNMLCCFESPLLLLGLLLLAQPVAHHALKAKCNSQLTVIVLHDRSNKHFLD